MEISFIQLTYDVYKAQFVVHGHICGLRGFPIDLMFFNAQTIFSNIPYLKYKVILIYLHLTQNYRQFLNFIKYCLLCF